MRGRKPTPRSVRELRGNPGRRPLPEGEPRPPVALPDKPEWLDDDASAEWDRVVPQLTTLGILTELDRAVLVAYVTAWSDLCELRRQIRETGWTIPTGDGESQKRNPLASSLREAYERLRSAGSELGLTPSARIRLAQPGKSGQNPLEELKVRRRKRR